ncbi:MAG: hypothetical protein KTR31_24010 [Myxococcales bacterium]|nr:hypothetical protein [Myxococcales bacterium]
MFTDFVRQGWNEHADHPRAVLDRLDEGLALAWEGTHLASLAALGIHVAGEHLGDFDQGFALLDRIEASPLHVPDSKPGRSVARSRAILLLVAGQAPEGEALLSAAVDPDRSQDSVRAQVYAIVASMRAGRSDVAGAVAALDVATAAAAYGPTADDPAARALAVTGNNLAIALEESTERDEAGTALMKRAAQLGRTYWEIAGDWTNVALAEVRLCHTHLAASEPQAARVHAEAALALADAHDAEPGDRIAPTTSMAKAQLRCGEVAQARRFVQAARELLPELQGWLEDFYTPIVDRLDGWVSEAESQG